MRRNYDQVAEAKPSEEFDRPLPPVDVYEDSEPATKDRNVRELPPIQVLGFTTAELLSQIEPERYLLPGLVPTEAYTLIAGALSAYKSTLLTYLALWRATGFDLLNLEPDGAGCDIGPALAIVYEDSDRRFRSRTQRIVQHAHAGILEVHGKRSASDFLERIEKNFRRIVFTGQAGATLVCRGPSGIIQPNESLIVPLTAAARGFTAGDLLIGVDPLRLAITGSQNDDDGADVVVHTLNRIASSLPNSGIVICSHTTKGDAKEPADGGGYTAASYSTSGSALYSQHARSNFLISRIKADRARELLDVGDIDADELERQPIARLTHGRLSHGGESADRYLRNVGGALVPIEKRETRTTADRIHEAFPVVAAAIDRLIVQNLRVSAKALLADDECKRRLGPVREAKKIMELLEENGFLEFTGTTKNRTGRITDKGKRHLGALE
ncbi:AAA family ATPase [Povalibacter sp.]|uniref:AAA family ATPase n=1 Tax=Povalibacter sp. TaxID=1962978 RepID=UPI002F4099AD